MRTSSIQVGLRLDGEGTAAKQQQRSNELGIREIDISTGLTPPHPTALSGFSVLMESAAVVCPTQYTHKLSNSKWV
jgi:hypothetical protein